MINADTADGVPRIRGLVSQTKVERQLGHPLPVTAMARTFSELEQVLAGH